MDGRRKRGTAKHAGVVLKRRVLPSGAIGWRAKVFDPDARKTMYETLPAADAATEEQRTAWAIRRKKELEARGTAVEKGAPRKTGRELKDVLEDYFTKNAGRLRDRTVTAYRVATSELLAFAKEQGIKLADKLLADSLVDFRSWVLERPRKVAGKAKGTGKGKPRSVVTGNQRLRSIRTVLQWVRSKGLVPMLSSDHIRDNLKSEEEPTSLPDPLKQHEIPALLRAAMRHDAAMFKITREENRAGGKPGSTPKHEPVAPFVLFMLLTGMRRDEARMLRWDRVDLRHMPSGAIKLTPADTKTKRGRTVDLKIAPALQQLLTGMRLRAGEDPLVFGFARENKDGTVTLQPRSDEEVTKTLPNRLTRDYAAPKFTWMRLRDTAATYMVNGTVFGYDTLRRAPKQLGHTVAVAEAKYWDVVNIEHADTLEAAMGIEAEALAIVRQAGGERLAEDAMKALA